MREYKTRKNRQKKAYFSDRFYITPNIAKIDISKDKQFLKDYDCFSKKIEIIEAYIQKEHLVIIINKNDILKTVTCLKVLEYDMLMELSALDYLEEKDGFEIFYELLSISKRKRIRVKCFLKKDESIESIISIFKSANWSEREMYDMFGVKIVNHPNMKRLLMPDDWYDYPLKKTYPLQGDETASWYEVDKIFGKDAREIIGAEQRDSAAIDRYDTKRFARLGHEVPFGADISEKEPDTKINYQEKKLSKIIKELKPEKSVVLKRRR